MVSTSTYKFKIVILGDMSVGKTSILRQFIEKRFEESYTKTIGCDFLIKTMDYSFSNKVIKVVLEVWDIAGDERFQSLTDSYLRGADGEVIIFDVNNRLSFKNIKKWDEMFIKRVGYNKPRVILGNKVDLIESKEVLNQLVSEMNDEIFFASAKTGENVDRAFYKLIYKIYGSRVLNLF